MTRFYGAALLGAGALHVVAALGPGSARPHALVLGQLAMLVGVWGLAFVAIPHSRRAGWLMALSGSATALLIATGYVLTRRPAAGGSAEAMALAASDVAIGIALLFLGAAAWSLLRTPQPWRTAGGFFLVAALTIPVTWVTSAVLASSLRGVVTALHAGVTVLLLALAGGVLWSGWLLWRADG